MVDRRNIWTLTVLAGAFYLIYASLFKRSLAVKYRGELCLCTMWLVIPFIPGAALSNMSNSRSRLAATGLFMMVGFTVAERVLYVPSIGYCLFLAFILDRAVQPSDSADKPKADTEQAKTSDVAPKSSRRKLVIGLAVVLIALFALRFVALRAIAQSHPPAPCGVTKIGARRMGSIRPASSWLRTMRACSTTARTKQMTSRFALRNAAPAVADSPTAEGVPHPRGHQVRPDIVAVADWAGSHLL